MKPIVYEIKRTLSSKFVILMIVAIIGLSSLLAYESGAGFGSAASVPRLPSVVGGYYVSGTSLNVVAYAYNAHGEPVSDLAMNVSFQNVEKAGTTGTSGFVNFSFPYNLSGSTEVNYNYSYSLFGIRQHTVKNTLLYVIPGTNSSEYNLLPGIYSSTNSSNLGFIVMYVGDNGSNAPQTGIYLAEGNGSVVPSSEVYQNNSMNFSFSDFRIETIFPTLAAGQYNQTFYLAINSNGSFITANALKIGKLSVYSPMTESQLQSLIFQGIGSILGLLIPILGVFAGYLTYGKDKTTGVLESVLKRPVTRCGLISSRFIANSVSIVGSVIVSMVIADVLIHHYFHIYPTLYFSMFFAWTYVVEGLAFLGLIFMFSHLVKSQGALLGITIAVFVVLGLFWTIIPAVIMLALGINASSSMYIPLNLVFNFASPSGYNSLISFFFTNGVGTITTVTANPATYGINEFTLLLSGVLWVAVPIIVALSIARRSD